MPGPTNRKWFPKIYMAITDNGAILEIKPPQLNFSDSLRPVLQRIFKERFTALRADIAPISLELIRGSSKDKPKMILTLTPNDCKQFEQILEKTESALLGVCELWREIYHFRMKYREEMRTVAKNAELKIQERATEAVRLRMVSIPE